VRERLVYGLGQTFAGSIVVAAFWAAVWLPFHVLQAGQRLPPWYLPVPDIAVLAGMGAGVLVHEAGHLLAGLAMGADIRAFRLGGPRGALRFRVRGVYFSLGFPYHGQVEVQGVLSAWRRAVVAIAGSAADLVAGALVVTLACLVLTGQPAQPPAIAVGLGMAAIGLANLMPYRTRKGGLTDGARLPGLRTDARLARQRVLLRAARRLQSAGRAAELLDLHAEQGIPGGTLAADQARLLVEVEYAVSFLPRVPADTIALIERRLEFLMPFVRGGEGEAPGCLTLSHLRLQERRFAEAEALAQQALTAALEASRRNYGDEEEAAAVMCVARQALRRPHEDVLAGTVLPRTVIEKRMAELRWTVDPEQMLALLRQGDLMARVGAGSIAWCLRRAGRVADLLELHEWIARTREEDLTACLQAPGLLRSIQDVEYNVLLLPDVAADVIDVAADRVEFVLEHHADDDNLVVAEHTMALASLRRGRYTEVEPLCRPALMEADFPADYRASILATVALARRARGKRYRGLLTEAVFLAPDADLVQEASQAPGQE
jgi:hypothetical protein